MIAEYLTLEISFRALGQKHGIDYRMIHQWVQRYKSKMKIKPNKCTNRLITLVMN